MNKKAIYSTLSTIVAMIVLSVSLVFTVGPMVRADEEKIDLVPTEYLYIENGRLGSGRYYIFDGFTDDGKAWILDHERYRVEIPTSVTNIYAFAFSSCSGLISIEIPITVTTVYANVFIGCNNLTEIIVRNPDLMENPNLAEYKNLGVMRYEAPQSVTDPVDPEPETPVENDDENQVVTPNRKNNNALLAWIGGGVAAGLGTVAAVAGIVAMKKRK